MLTLVIANHQEKGMEGAPGWQDDAPAGGDHWVSGDARRSAGGFNDGFHACNNRDGFGNQSGDHAGNDNTCRNCSQGKIILINAYTLANLSLQRATSLAM